MAKPNQRMCAKCGQETALSRRQVAGAEQTGSVDIDLCERCGGFWLDWGELSRISDMKALIDGAVSGTAWKRDLQKGRCPACDDRPALGRIAIGAFGVDRCPTCLGLWFDRGELGPTLSAAQLDRVPRPLRTILKVDHRRLRRR